MEFTTLLQNLTQAAMAGDGKSVAECFTADGVYHDVFYGAFRGRAAIADMIENYFHRDASNFIWDMHEPVSDGHTGYARYVFSYDSNLPEAVGKRALFEGICITKLEQGLIHEYREVANHGVGLTLLEFAPERLAKIFRREAKELASRAESTHHGIKL